MKNVASAFVGGAALVAYVAIIVVLFVGPFALAVILGADVSPAWYSLAAGEVVTLPLLGVMLDKAEF